MWPSAVATALNDNLDADYPIRQERRRAAEWSR